MKNALLIIILLTPALFADKKPKRNATVKDSSPTGIKTDVGRHLQVENTGVVTLSKKGQRASYNVVGASEKGALLLGLDTKADEGAFKVQLAKGAKITFIKPQDEEGGKALTDVNGHLLVEHTGIKTGENGYLVVEANEIATVWLDSWPPPITKHDNAADLLIVKAFGLLISYGEIKLKKPPTTPEQRAERAK